MKPILLILLLAFTCSAQTNLDWNEVAKSPKVRIMVAEIARGPKEVKFWIRLDFPDGPPTDFPVVGVSSVRAEMSFNCVKKTAKAINGYGYFYNKYGEFMGKRKDGQTIKFPGPTVGNYIIEYFCEQPSAKPTKAPTLKPK